MNNNSNLLFHFELKLLLLLFWKLTPKKPQQNHLNKSTIKRTYLNKVVDQAEDQKQENKNKLT